MTAQITYDVSAPLTSNTIDVYHDVPDIELVPVEVQAAIPAERTIELEVLFDTMNDGTNRAMVSLSIHRKRHYPTSDFKPVQHDLLRGRPCPHHALRTYFGH